MTAGMIHVRVLVQSIRRNPWGTVRLLHSGAGERVIHGMPLLTGITPHASRLACFILSYAREDNDSLLAVHRAFEVIRQKTLTLT